MRSIVRLTAIGLVMVTVLPTRAEVPQALPQAADQAFQRARQLQDQGKADEAFRAYLAVPGGEYAAARLGRSNPEPFLDAAAKLSADPACGPRALLVKGDLLLALGDAPGALAACREFAAHFARRPGDGWAGGFVPADYYPVEPPAPPREGQDSFGRAGAAEADGRAAALPFALGPGSHRDNWLIRRFIAAESWDDAAREFARVWALYLSAAGAKALPGPGMEFALDYAYFLQRQKQPGAALALLSDVLLRIDMDRVSDAPMPGAPMSGARPSWGGWDGQPGVSRVEFVRLTFGLFKTAGREGELIAAVEKQIDAGRNPLRRVLARLRLHQGQDARAMDAELAYIGAAGFDPLGAVLRRGAVYEQFKKLPEAVAEYEKAAALPDGAADLPGADEEANASAAVRRQPMLAHAGGAARAGLSDRLLRLYGALGETAKALDVTLGQIDANPPAFSAPRALEQAAARFGAAGATDRLNAWLKAKAAASPDAGFRAAAYWAAGDRGAAAAAVVEKVRAESAAGGHNHPAARAWAEVFAGADKGAARALLAAAARADPRDTQTLLQWLDAEDRAPGPEMIGALESILDADAEFAFPRGKGAYNRTHFQDYFDLAYRLARLYEKAGQPAKLQALALRIARGGKPFGRPDLEQHAYRDVNGVPEFSNAALALAVEQADARAELPALADALENSPWAGALAQAKRRLAESWPPPGGANAPDFPWANLPPGVRLLAGCENVLCLARDDRHVYAGHPWGVAVYDFSGRGVTRVALGAAALDLAVFNGALWAATPAGVYRVDLAGFAVTRLLCDQELGERERREARQNPPGAGQADAHVNGVNVLGLRGDTLWIGGRRNVRALDTRTGQVRVFSNEEMGFDTDFDASAFFFDGRYVWADGYPGACRYDADAGTWAVVNSAVNSAVNPAVTPAAGGAAREPGGGNRRHPPHLIGFEAGVLWGHVYVNDALRDRPCLIDRDTLEARPVPIEGVSGAAACINGPFCFFGRWQGKLVFGPQTPAFAYDPQAGRLRPLPLDWHEKLRERPDLLETPAPPGLVGGFQRRRSPDVLACADDTTHRHLLLGQPFEAGEWAMLDLPDGTRVIGGRADTTRHQYPSEDWPLGTMVHDAPDSAGGLYFLRPAPGGAPPGKPGPRRVSAEPHADTLRGESVFFTTPDLPPSDRLWAGTTRGLALLDRDGRLLAHLSRQDGLVANRIKAGAALTGRLYFAAEWGDSAGGLAVFDPATRVFTSLTVPDGLACDKLASIKVQGAALDLTYGPQYLRSGDGGYQIFPPGRYAPADGSFTPPGEPRRLNQTEADRAAGAGNNPAPRQACPWLGGFVLARQRVGGKTFVCGTRGLVVLDDPAAAALISPPPVPELAVKPALDPRAAQLDEARRTKLPSPIPADVLRKVLAGPNPYLAADALAAAWEPMRQGRPEYVPLAAGQVRHPNARVRSTAMQLLIDCPDAAVVPALEAALNDADPYPRALAALSLARRGRDVPLDHFRQILDRPDGYGNLPFGAASTTGVRAGPEMVYQALAPRADAGVFALFLARPPRPGDYDHATRVFPPLGRALLQHPEAAGVLLKAADDPTGRTEPVQFARHVFAAAGKAMLPALHQALTSPDRVVRSNAARACGEIGDPSSAAPLLAALDLESGLSRASIVWALGRLKAADALPRLKRMYVEARADERRRGGGGYRAQQAVAAARSQYDSIAEAGAAPPDWDEIKAAVPSRAARPTDPRDGEALLSAADILRAVRTIGPDKAQEFYRQLSGDADAEAREEAARALGEGAPPEGAANVPVLRNLLADDSFPARLAAAVSLVRLGQDAGRAPVLAALASRERWPAGAALRELARVPDPRRLAFARAAIEACAGNASLDDAARELARELLRKTPAGTE